MRRAASATTLSLPSPHFRSCRRLARRLRCTSTPTSARTRWRSTDFCAREEKQLFEKLITVSGIGPSLAIKTLSGMAAADMVGAIRSNDFARLTKIPGIGRKTAERMCVELRDKLEGFGAAQAVVTHSAVEEDVISALTNLGYQRAMAEKAVERAVQAAGRENFDAIFRAALGALSK